jgi:predicted ATPase
MTVPLAHGQLPLVGRERELATLTAMLAEAVRGHGAVALVAGEPGIGKTRLVEELVATAAEQGARPLWGRCYEGEGVPAFWPWQQILRGYLRDPAQEPERLRETLPASAADLLQLLPELGPLLPDSTPPEPDPDPTSARFRLFAGATELLTAAASRRPLLLLLDDLHWADVPTLSLLQFLADELADVPLLVVATYRDVEVGRDHALAPVLTRLRRTRGFRQLALGGLQPEAVAELLAALGADGASDGYAEALWRHTDGNPFFLGETVRHLADTGRLGEMRQGTEPAVGLSASVPDAVRDVILNRCGRLSPAGQALLNAASVIGIEFDLGTLSGITELQQLPLLDVLDEIVAAGLVTAVSSVPPRFRFGHALVREALYEEIGAGARVRLHQQVGTAIEAVCGADVEPVLAELAWHFAQAAPAGTVSKALGYCARGGTGAAGLRLRGRRRAVRAGAAGAAARGAGGRGTALRPADGARRRAGAGRRLRAGERRLRPSRRDRRPAARAARTDDRRQADRAGRDRLWRPVAANQHHR